MCGKAAPLLRNSFPVHLIWHCNCCDTLFSESYALLARTTESCTRNNFSKRTTQFHYNKNTVALVIGVHSAHVHKSVELFALCVFVTRSNISVGFYHHFFHFLSTNKKQTEEMLEFFDIQMKSFPIWIIFIWKKFSNSDAEIKRCSGWRYAEIRNGEQSLSFPKWLGFHANKKFFIINLNLNLRWFGNI